ncbi:GTF2IRD2 [Cordylochernes scorpioides]|uniref:GTF2IRD2 n=1 Tax=Cordylochernes scorpioides TaxID=51811 RepID=A0ABY6K6K7_9ARAC|nr:GTF2IRD2 [Cordylochernes scorpioides]
MCDQVNPFKCKLVLWEKQLKNEDLMHFPTCNMYKSSLGETASYQKYAEKILSLRNEFETRFSDFKSLEGKFTLYSSIFSINIELVPNHMQIEVIDIQCDSDLKAKFIEVGVSEFYKYLPARFENTRKLAYEIMSMFGSTYRCEQLFSLMKGNKSPIKSRITDVHLESLSRIFFELFANLSCKFALSLASSASSGEDERYSLLDVEMFTANNTLLANFQEKNSTASLELDKFAHLPKENTYGDTSWRYMTEPRENICC